MLNCKKNREPCCIRPCVATTQVLPRSPQAEHEGSRLSLWPLHSQQPPGRGMLLLNTEIYQQARGGPGMPEKPTCLRADPPAADPLPWLPQPPYSAPSRPLEGLFFWLQRATSPMQQPS